MNLEIDSRELFIIHQALAMGIAMIERLPELDQPWSDGCDMVRLLERMGDLGLEPKSNRATMGDILLAQARQRVMLVNATGAPTCDLVADVSNSEADEGDFIEEGSTPTPEPDFIDEEEDKSPKAAAHLKRGSANEVRIDVDNRAAIRSLLA